MSDPLAAPASGQAAALVVSLGGFPDELSRLLAGQTIDALKRPTSDGGWGVIENLGHLVDWEDVARSRVRAIIAEDDPRLPELDDQLWEIEHDYRAQDPFKVLDRFRGQRRELVDFLSELPLASWSRTGKIGVQPSITLVELADRFRQHDAEHGRAIADALG